MSVDRRGAVEIRCFETDRTDPEELRLALTRPPIDDVIPSETVMARTEDIFGRRITPQEAVEQILADVEVHGDAAVADYAERIDGVTLAPEQFFLDEDEIAAAVHGVDPTVMDQLRLAHRRIRSYHEAQIERSWFQEGPYGEILGQRVLPLERVACYVPGGRAPLFSTALMSVVPAKIAGVGEVIAATPCDKDGQVNPITLAALKEAGADRVLRIGGAQAIGALAYGTTWIPQVDKIVGPGNLFVILAKKAVYGRVGIDALNGPSEVAIIADAEADPALVAADMAAQAEHDFESSALLITVDRAWADQVVDELDRRLADLPTAEVARASLKAWGAIVICRDLDEAVSWANVAAAEHVQLMVAEPWDVLPRIHHAGAVFLGPYAPVAAGDYIAGPNHILPTNGTAAFASPLGVYDFVRRSSVVALNAQAWAALAPDAASMARREGLHGHARSLEARKTEEDEEKGTRPS